MRAPRERARIARPVPFTKLRTQIARSALLPNERRRCGALASSERSYLLFQRAQASKVSICKSRFRFPAYAVTAIICLCSPAKQPRKLRYDTFREAHESGCRSGASDGPSSAQHERRRERHRNQPNPCKPPAVIGCKPARGTQRLDAFQVDGAIEIRLRTGPPKLYGPFEMRAIGDVAPVKNSRPCAVTVHNPFRGGTQNRSVSL